MAITDGILSAEDHLSHPARASEGLIRSKVFDLVIIKLEPVHIDVDLHSFNNVHFTPAP